MKTIEEQLWDYIDGNCSAVETLEIETKIASNLQYHAVYQELLVVHQELNTLDLEEPSLSFTRNVMDKVAFELPPVALKTKIDNRIIYSIGAIFVISLLAIFSYALATSKWDFEMPKIAFSIDTTRIFTPNFLLMFVIFDVALGLIYLDNILRKRSIKKEAK
jgi:hypothetical protein